MREKLYVDSQIKIAYAWRKVKKRKVARMVKEAKCNKKKLMKHNSSVTKYELRDVSKVRFSNAGSPRKKRARVSYKGARTIAEFE